MPVSVIFDSPTINHYIRYLPAGLGCCYGLLSLLSGLDLKVYWRDPEVMLSAYSLRWWLYPRTVVS